MRWTITYASLKLSIAVIKFRTRDGRKRTAIVPVREATTSSIVVTGDTLLRAIRSEPKLDRKRILDIQPG